jgi:hypothetical protein
MHHFDGSFQLLGWFLVFILVGEIVTHLGNTNS